MKRTRVILPVATVRPAQAALRRYQDDTEQTLAQLGQAIGLSIGSVHKFLTDAQPRCTARSFGKVQRFLATLEPQKRGRRPNPASEAVERAS